MSRRKHFVIKQQLSIFVLMMPIFTDCNFLYLEHRLEIYINFKLVPGIYLSFK